MIIFSNAGRAYKERSGRLSWVIRNLSLRLPPGFHVGVLGGRNAGKSTLIRLAAGIEDPSEGTIIRKAGVSWPSNTFGTFTGGLTGKQNLRFLADVYGRNFEEVLDFVARFSELGGALDLQFNRYRHEMRSRLVTSAYFAFRFEHSLVDEILTGGDQAFRKRALDYFERDLDRTSLFMATSNPELVERYCKLAGVLHNGKFKLFDSVPEAVDMYHRLHDRVVPAREMLLDT